MAQQLSNAVHTCVVSFIDLYEKMRQNFPGVRAVTPEEQAALIEAFVRIGRQYHIAIRTCCENVRWRNTARTFPAA